MTRDYANLMQMLVEKKCQVILILEMLMKVTLVESCLVLRLVDYTIKHRCFR